MRVFVAILLLVPVLCMGDSVIIGGFSKHPYGAFNESHPALGYQSDNYEMAVFKNSYGSPSLMVTKIDTLYKSWGYRIGVANNYKKDAIAINGYKPILQAVYFSNNYDIAFGPVTTITFKVGI